jgi:hypothetical protein
MAPEAGKYQKYWTDAKKEFTRATKVSKPGETFLFWRKGTGVEAALKKLDSATAKSWQTQKGFDNFRNAMAAFTDVFLPYRDTLDRAVIDAKKGANIPKKVAQATYTQALETLNMHLRDIENAGSERQSSSLTAVNFTKNVPIVIGRAKTFIAAVRHDPRPATFNTGIRRAARDITQQIGNVEKLRGQGMDLGVTEPRNLFAVLAAWGDAGRKVDDNADQAAVLRETGALEQAVLGVEIPGRRHRRLVEGGQDHRHPR